MFNEKEKENVRSSICNCCNSLLKLVLMVSSNMMDGQASLWNGYSERRIEKKNIVKYYFLFNTKKKLKWKLYKCWYKLRTDYEQKNNTKKSNRKAKKGTHIDWFVLFMMWPYIRKMSLVYNRLNTLSKQSRLYTLIKLIY